MEHHQSAGLHGHPSRAIIKGEPRRAKDLPKVTQRLRGSAARAHGSRSCPGHGGGEKALPSRTCIRATSQRTLPPPSHSRGPWTLREGARLVQGHTAPWGRRGGQRPLSIRYPDTPNPRRAAPLTPQLQNPFPASDRGPQGRTLAWSPPPAAQPTAPTARSASVPQSTGSRQARPGHRALT